MLFHRLALKRILQYLYLDDLFAEDKPRLKHRRDHKTMLLIDQKMDMYVSILLSLISMFICLTIPIAALEKPSEIFKENDMDIFYEMSSWLERHLAMIDRFIIALSLILVCVSAKMVIDGILGTNISLSPWRECGKYNLPSRFRCT